MWIASSFVLSYGGCAALALAMDRHHRQLWRSAPSRVTRSALRVLGAVLWTLSCAAGVARWGLPVGAVAWLGMLSTSGLAFIAVSAYAPRTAAMLAPAGILVSTVLMAAA